MSGPLAISLNSLSIMFYGACSEHWGTFYGWDDTFIISCCFQWFITFPQNYLWGLKFSYAFLLTGQQWIYLESWRIISTALLELSKLQGKKPKPTKPKLFLIIKRKNVGMHFEHPVTQKNVVTTGSKRHHFIIIKFRQKKKKKDNEKL